MPHELEDESWVFDCGMVGSTMQQRRLQISAAAEA
jgi:hypothetical protein